MFTLHPQLQKDCIIIGDYPLCRLLLLNDRQYPWLVLVPRRQDVSEVYQLSEDDQLQLQKESSSVLAAMAAHFKADKMNVAALGNVVPQLHIHHIARYQHDPAWPKPVWGVLPTVAYGEDELQKCLLELRELLSAGDFPLSQDNG
jgi:diadenosine tetraphosphate (Ap4A) HIT family hydrolase